MSMAGIVLKRLNVVKIVSSEEEARRLEEKGFQRVMPATKKKRDSGKRGGDGG